MTTTEVAALADGLSKAQKVVALRCGDVIDRLPCGLCGAGSLKNCPVSMANRVAARDAINMAGAIANCNGHDALRNHLLASGGA